ncbi:MAG: bifunctional diaminohydroxyphosphoribosylaminopyrimidine deaminase/5-amino-6-(5-phosphoribosylamino)uracil reductase RibD [Acidimicrobiia bacterium]|nr:bifunctional diaminohydroxyphosphoribosylaminopyrimidine deaminase/5-amino-6-(5-phosphoribosylamino)uracil reductase RibD [Acidimicrobiia bacterium]
MPPPITDHAFGPADEPHLRRAAAVATAARLHSSPNPWVGAVVVGVDGSTHVGHTAPPGGPHAERRALDAAGDAARGSTVYTTLEPCSHHGRTPPCTDALIAAGVSRVVIGTVDPDSDVAGVGIERLDAAGIATACAVGTTADLVRAQLAPYLHHRRTGRPYVVLKMAATLDGRTAAPDGTSSWITGAEARADVHRVRAESDAVIVGAATIRVDDPALTVRDFHPSGPTERPDLHPRRIVLGAVPDGARVRPAETYDGDITALVERLGHDGVVQLLVEGGSTVAGEFHRAGLVDRYMVYVAPALLGGDDGLPVLGGSGVPTMGELWRGRMDRVRRLGADVCIEVVPADEPQDEQAN